MDRRRPRPRAARLALAAALVLAAGAPVRAALPAPQRAEVARVLALVRAAGEEYREALDASGRVVRPIELEEARLFLAEAGDHARRLGGAAPADLGAGLGALARALESRLPLVEVEARVEALCTSLSAATGVAEELLPPAPPSAARGRAVFEAHCISCHGAEGRGDGPEARRVEVKPADFTDPSFMRGETPADFFHVISVGRRRAAMPAWDAVLTVQERWDAVAYVWSFGTTPAHLAEGQGLFVAHCAGCHGAGADGRGPYASALAGAVPDLAQAGALARRTDAELEAVVRDGIAGTAMPAYARTLSDDERRKAVSFLRAASLGAVAARGESASGASAAAAGDAAAKLAEVRRLVEQAVDSHRRGDPRAVDLASDAYLRFEPLEPALGARDQDVVRRVEEAFLQLRGTLRDPSLSADAAGAAVRAGLEAAEASLGSPADAWARFVQAAAIILREGFEVVLILGALIAWVVKSGNPGMKRPIWTGAAAGLGASVVTAALLATVFRLRPAAAEVLEGAAMLLAAVVLFWVSYWILSKAEAERWQRYIRGKVEHALAAGRPTALAAAAFLAVYREGFETVLFYQALVAGAPARDLMVPAGFVAGSVVLAIVYVGLARFGMRVPIGPFFLVTGSLLIGMSITFAGKGVHELQEAGVVGTTLVPGVPEVSLLGLYPTVETLAAQGCFLVLVAYALVLTLRRRRTRAAAVAARAALVLFALVAVAPARGEEGLFLSEAEAPGAVFPDGDRFERTEVDATPALRARMQAHLDGVTPSLWEGRYVVFRAFRGERPLGQAIVVEEIGKHRPITFVVGLRPGGVVEDVAVMAYREPYGSEVRSERFLVQYQGARPDAPLRPYREIRNVAGATLSVEAASRAVRKAQALAAALATGPS